ncbi:hypothetical protein L9F63_014350 [Diploptera punctata]|uniref:Kazal-like domain-containing protein n=1 Tax=Diploptera punctata TaxID=6984 RepID=A0AAD8EKP5_DIPPU|nr:hypothetical protein L9F63_014350 [Diploptera punctata]
MLAYLDCQYPDVYLPICGSDSKDYFNYDQLLCIASKHPERNLTVQYMYPCVCHGILDTDKESPVCTSDKHTFPSRAAFKCIKAFARDSKAIINSEGVCEGEKVDECWAEELPSTLWRPLCGTDDLTYNSLWHLRCANSINEQDVQMKQEGACPCKVSRYYKPLCASNNVTYPNIEIFECDQHMYNLHDVTILREGNCEWSEDSNCEDRVPQFDESISNGLCGSDGITYLTAQQFKCVRETKQDLKLLHDGPCKESELPDDITPEQACDIEAKFPVLAPVCGSNNITYMSIYTLRCMTPNITGLIVQHKGECNSKSDICREANMTATLDLPYVCASDGNTYINLFAFWCIKLSIPELQVSHFDECV